MRAWRDIRAAWARRALGDAVVAAWELARARREMQRTPVDELSLLKQGAPNNSTAELTLAQQSLVNRVAYVVPAMGKRVPWRSDCLVQALAARRWIARAGVTSDLCIGVRKDDAGFQAHAWLKVGEQIVTGGDVATYAELPPVGPPGGLASL